MKIRAGFVSNSSSSSFCIYGVQVDRDDIKNIAHLITKEQIEEYCEGRRWTAPEHFDPEHDEYSPSLILDVYLPPLGLTYVDDSEGGALYIGRDSGDIGDDETGRQFKESTHILTKMFPNISVDDICWHEGEIAC